MIRHITGMFPHLDAPKTHRGAQARLDKFTRCFEQTVEPSPETMVLTAIVARDDGRFIPVVIIGRSAPGWVLNMAMQFNCGITNVA